MCGCVEINGAKHCSSPRKCAENGGVLKIVTDRHRQTLSLGAQLRVKAGRGELWRRGRGNGKGGEET